MKIFVSVGTNLRPQHETFVAAVEQRLRAIGLTPLTIGRNTYSTQTPLRAVVELMADCAGIVVIALERFRFEGGVERPGADKQSDVGPTSLPTVWNQIEAAMAYTRNLPLLVLAEEGLRCDGLLETSNEWYVLRLSADEKALSDPAFHGLLSDWHKRLVAPTHTVSRTLSDPASMTVKDLIGALKPSQLWAVLAALCVIASALFMAGKLWSEHSTEFAAQHQAK